ncbi:MAG: ISAs1 family transposase [Candidatus Omnitrophica bacterium]|nr:ISAs1 family transposase [Candidatus Omnitrophota bacterium]
MDKSAGDFVSHFSIIRDPRIERTKLHKLESILFIAVCAVLCGIESWEGMEEFGEGRKEWLAKYVDLTNGIPSHDTFGRLFAQLAPQEFEKSFSSWIQGVYQKTEGEVIAIDGKTVRGSRHGSIGQSPLHLVSAWAAANHLWLGQVETEEKSNEIEAIPRLLKILDLKGCIVTIDAMGCQTEIAKEIQDKGADYVLALKGNQETLHEDVKQYWEDPQLPEKEYQEYKTTDKGHGRLEIRKYRVSDQIQWLEPRKDWKGLRSIVEVESHREIGEQKTLERRYYLTSLKADAKEIAKAIRTHWEIENKAHWCLDVTFGEDHSTVRIKQAAQNFALLRRLAMNMLRKETSVKKSLNMKRHRAALRPEYLELVLAIN